MALEKIESGEEIAKHIHQEGVPRSIRRGRGNSVCFPRGDRL